jgi:hypothetical protein
MHVITCRTIQKVEHAILVKVAIILGTHIQVNNQFFTRSKAKEVSSIAEEARPKVGQLPFTFHVYVILFMCGKLLMNFHLAFSMLVSN